MDPRCYDKEYKTQTYKGEDCCEMMPPQENVCNRVFVHEVNHTIPVHTKIINHHVYKHTFTPMYTCEEVNTCENVYQKNF